MLTPPTSIAYERMTSGSVSMMPEKCNTCSLLYGEFIAEFMIKLFNNNKKRKHVIIVLASAPKVYQASSYVVHFFYKFNWRNIHCDRRLFTPTLRIFYSWLAITILLICSSLKISSKVCVCVCHFCSTINMFVKVLTQLHCTGLI